ncbi:MAG: Gx transporter family protein [Eubacterium sp.]|nr:Gx transporter family protein [Eubacterium sp.]
MNSKSKRVALFGLMVALAFMLSYLESLLPFNFGVPGVKLGLANLVVVVALYTMKKSEAFAIAIIRILLASVTFGNPLSLLYSLAGGLLSFCIMALTKDKKLSVVGVSMLGGISHNIAQITVAAIVTGTSRIAYYLPVLLVAGTVTGFLLGYLSKIIIDRVKKVNEKTGS